MRYAAFTLAAFLIGLGLVNIIVDRADHLPFRLWPVLTGIGGCALLVIVLWRYYT